MCTNPNLIRVIKLTEKHLDMIPNLQKLGWKINFETSSAFKFIPHKSRDLPLEEIPEYMSQEIIEVGCGGCIECRLQYSKDWANRCYLESLLYKDNYFITLTYDDDHIHLGDTGNPTCSVDDLRLFVKTLRDKFRHNLGVTGVRFFGCIEYGDKSFRPHAHIVMFNCPIPDLTNDIQDKDGNIIHLKSKSTGMYMLWSKFVKDCWEHGNITIEDCNWNTAAYVSRYILKKQKGEDSKVYSDRLKIEAPRLIFSNRPGIGTKYFLEHYDEFLSDPHIYAPKSNQSCLVSSLPRAFTKKIKDKDIDIYEARVESSKDSIKKFRSLLQDTTINRQRSYKESSDIKKFEAFARDF